MLLTRKTDTAHRDEPALTASQDAVPAAQARFARIAGRAELWHIIRGYFDRFGNCPRFGS